MRFWRTKACASRFEERAQVVPSIKDKSKDGFVFLHANRTFAVSICIEK